MNKDNDLKTTSEEKCLLLARSYFNEKKYKEAMLAYENSLDSIKNFKDDAAYTTALVENDKLKKALSFLISKIEHQKNNNKYFFDLISIYFFYIIKFEKNEEFKLFFKSDLKKHIFKVQLNSLLSIFEYACKIDDPLSISLFESYIESNENIDKRLYRAHISHLINSDKTEISCNKAYEKSLLYLKKNKDIVLFSTIFKHITCISFIRTQKLISLSLELFGIDKLRTLKINKSLILSYIENIKNEQQYDLSFKRLLSYEYRNGEIGGFKLPYQISSKVNTYSIGAALGIKTPLIESNLKLLDIELSDNLVIKPIDGNQSNGVFLIYNENKIFDVNEGVYLKGYNNFLERADTYRREKKYRNLWIVEKLLSHNNEMARDIKFYCFYGKALLALESVRGSSKVLRNWHDRSGDIVETGRYKNLNFKSSGIKHDLFKLAETLSLNVPTPFMRIDFLIADDGAYIGEFTPIPFGYWEFNVYYDRLLGYELYAARNRLLNDLISEKKFHHIKTLLKDVK